MIPDLTEWKFVRKDIMRSRTVGDWDASKKEIQIWSGLDPLSALEVGMHELKEMVLCSLQDVTDETILKFDKAHGLAMDLSNEILDMVGVDKLEHEKKIVTYEQDIKVEGDK